MSLEVWSSSLFKSATSTMALVAVMAPIPFQPTSAHDTHNQRDDEGQYVRPARPLSSNIIERTDGTLEYLPSSWQPEINAADFERMSTSPGYFSLAERVREIQTLSGWSAGELGSVIGVGRVTVQNWLAGKPATLKNQESVIHIHDVMKRGERNPQIKDLSSWLLTPAASDGSSPKRLLTEGKYDRARTRAMVATPSLKRLEGIQEAAKTSPWESLLERDGDDDWRRG